MGQSYRPLPRHEGEQPKSKDRTLQLWGVILAVFALLLLVGLRGPDPNTAAIPQLQHKGKPAEYVEQLHEDESLGSNDAPSFTAPSFSAPSFSAPSFDAPSPEDAQPTPPPSPIDADASASGRSQNKYTTKYITPALKAYWVDMEEKRYAQHLDIEDQFGSWAPKGVETCHSCVFDGKVDYDHKSCPCKGHNYDNQTNWDVRRRKFCVDQQKEREKKFPFPQELRYTLELTYKDGIDALGHLKNPFQSLESGKNIGELPFDPATVKDHFLKLRAALAFYSEGEEHIEMLIDPKPKDPDYKLVIDQIANKFATAFVHGKNVTVGVLGDSTAAGADNCYWDAWPRSLERQLRPFFTAAKSNIVVRDAAHNGGYAMAPQIVCAEPLVGSDVEFMIQSSPFVHPENGRTILEDFVRRAAIEGVIVNIASESSADEIRPLYTKFGLTTGGWGQWPYGYKWYPSAGKSNWGRIGDGLCHTVHTRSGSSAVYSRNWHPGPLGHERQQDAYVFLWADAAVQALEQIETAISDSGGKIAPLKSKWPDKRRKATAADLPTPKRCESLTSSTPEFKQLCGDDSPIKYGFASCITSLRPTYGPGTKWEDVLVEPADAPSWDSDAADSRYGLKMEGPKSATAYDCNTAKNCAEPTESRPQTYETLRNTDVCIHDDYNNQLTIEKGWITVKLSKGTLNVGKISICGKCSDTPKVMLDGSGIDKKQYSIDWGKNVEWNFKDDSCGLITDSLPANALKDDVLVGIKCMGYIRYVFGQ